MATPLTPLTDEMLDKLPGTYRSQVETTRSMYGEEAGMEEYQDMLEIFNASGGYLAPEDAAKVKAEMTPGTRVNPSTVSGARAQALAKQALTIYDQAAAVGKPITKAEAN